MTLVLVNRLWEEEEAQHCRYGSEAELEVEDNAPGSVSDDDTTNEGTECWSDEST